MKIALGVVLCAAACAAQTAPSFDVASIRPAQGGGRGGPGMGGLAMLMAMPRSANIKVTPDSVAMHGVNFRSCVRWAYNVPDMQVTGPDWIDQQRYEIVAKVSSGASEDQMRLMMQTLLTERFKLAAHRISKETQAWVLTDSKSGQKLKESATEGEASMQPDLQKMQLGLERTSISDLINMLTGLLRAPVLDETGLKGRYDVKIDISKYLPDPNTPVDILTTVLRGIQQEFGLKLESKKMPLDFVVIDAAEKMPVEN
jgi:uncharacterized protein (TIGR03435 family)